MQAYTQISIQIFSCFDYHFVIPVLHCSYCYRVILHNPTIPHPDPHVRDVQQVQTCQPVNWRIQRVKYFLIISSLTASGEFWSLG